MVGLQVLSKLFSKINAQFKNMMQRMDGMENRIAANTTTTDITTTRKEVRKLDREVQRLDHRWRGVTRNIGKQSDEEMRESEQR